MELGDILCFGFLKECLISQYLNDYQLILIYKYTYIYFIFASPKFVGLNCLSTGASLLRPWGHSLCGHIWPTHLVIN
jgi:hypothetical protein